ncbi:MAG TPA: putative Ig domain-containing protein [Bryobacteraceae bacterium]
MKRVFHNPAWSFRAAAALAFAGAAVAQTVTLPPPSSISSGTSGYSGTTITAAGSAGAMTINGTANVTFTASGQIALLPGFTASASSGALFKALIQSVQITLNTAPSGLGLTVDGGACVAPCIFQWAPGSNHTVAAATQSGGAGVQYVFSSWSDSGAASHSVAPSASTTYTANFTTQYLLTTSVSPSGAGTISPGTQWFNSGTPITVSGSPHNGWVFQSFSGALSGGTSSQPLTMNGPKTVAASFYYSNPAITSSSPLPAGTSGASYNYTLAATGGAGPYAWRVTSCYQGSGCLPPGLGLFGASIQGTPTVAGTYNGIYIQLTDANGFVAPTLVASITVAGGGGSQLSVACSASANPTAGQTVTFTATASGGSGGYTYSWSQPASGTGPSLSFVPSAAATYYATVTARDSSNATVTGSCPAYVQAGGAALTITTGYLLPGGIAGTSYSASLAATGGAAPYTWSFASGALPPGLSLSTSGALNGTPAVSGGYSFVLRVTDNSGNSASQAFSVAIAATQGSPTFTTSVPSPVSVQAGNTAIIVLSSAGSNGYNSPITYSYDPSVWPSTIAATFSPFTGSSSPWSSTLTIYVTSSTAAGTYSLPILASGGGIQQSAGIILNVSAASQPHSAPSGVAATIYSQIIFYPDLKAIETHSVTMVDYATAAYYDAVAEAWYYRNGDPWSPWIHGYDVESTTADAGIRDVNGNPVLLDASDGADYSIESEHSVLIYTPVAVYDDYGDYFWDDPYGYSLIEAGDPESAPQENSIVPPIVEVFWTDQWIDLGPTADYTQTADQNPFISSISPNAWTPDPNVPTSTVITIIGSGFGSGGSAAGLAISGDNTVQISKGSLWSDTTIQANLSFAAGATPGDRAITVTSGGATGSGFLAGPARSATSNPKTFTVGGTSCPVSVANDGQKYSLGSDYLTTTIPLLATSSCSGTVVWTLNFFYQSSGGTGTSTSGPYQISGNLNQTANYQTPAGAGGRIDVSVAITIAGQTTTQGVTFYVDGTAIPNATIDARLQALFAGRALPYLMAGVAWHESNYMQFNPNTTLFGQSGRWPIENFATGKTPAGKCIGLMQLCPSSMSRAYDWTVNTADALNTVYNPFYQKAVTFQNQTITYNCNTPCFLPQMTEQQLELEALTWYGGFGANGQEPYLVPNQQRTSWVKTAHNDGVIAFIDGDASHVGVLQWCAAKGHPNCQ